MKQTSPARIARAERNLYLKITFEITRISVSMPPNTIKASFIIGPAHLLYVRVPAAD